MPDETVAMMTTPPLVPGNQTTEFALAKWVNIGAAVVMALAAAMEALQPHLGDHQWFSMAMGAVAGLVALLNTLGYAKGRASVKIAQQAAAATMARPQMPQP